MESLEQIIQKRLMDSYSMECGLAAAAARDIADDILGEFRVDPHPQVALFPLIEGMTRAHIEMQRRAR